MVYRSFLQGAEAAQLTTTTSLAAAGVWLFNFLTVGLCSLLITRKKASAETVFMLGFMVNVSLPSATALELTCHQQGISLSWLLVRVGAAGYTGANDTGVDSLCNCKMAYRDSNTVHTAYRDSNSRHDAIGVLER